MSGESHQFPKSDKPLYGMSRMFHLFYKGVLKMLEAATSFETIIQTCWTPPLVLYEK